MEAFTAILCRPDGVVVLFFGAVSIRNLSSIRALRPIIFTRLLTKPPDRYDAVSLSWQEGRSTITYPALTSADVDCTVLNDWARNTLGLLAAGGYGVALGLNLDVVTGARRTIPPVPISGPMSRCSADLKYAISPAACRLPATVNVVSGTSGVLEVGSLLEAASAGGRACALPVRVIGARVPWRGWGVSPGAPDARTMQRLVTTACDGGGKHSYCKGCSEVVWGEFVVEMVDVAHEVSDRRGEGKNLDANIISAVVRGAGAERVLLGVRAAEARDSEDVAGQAAKALRALVRDGGPYMAVVRAIGGGRLEVQDIVV
jgi:hypothetical protein